MRPPFRPLVLACEAARQVRGSLVDAEPKQPRTSCPRYFKLDFPKLVHGKPINLLEGEGLPGTDRAAWEHENGSIGNAEV